MLLFCASLLYCLANIHFGMSHSTAIGDRNHTLEEVVIEQTNGNNKIAVIHLDGIITGGGDVDHTGMDPVHYISEQLKAAQRDSDVKAVILAVNSPGGEVLASDEINMAIKKFQAESHKPVVASMGALAASGGYYVSAPCRWIVANELTITGSIGVIMHGYNYRQLMDKIGIRPHVYKSGRFKDMLSGEREPDSDKLSNEDQQTRDEEDKMVQSLIDETYQKFKSVVKSGREHAADENNGKGKALAGDWADYADGRILSGRRAMELGFVDELGDFDVAVQRAHTLVNISSATLVEYHVPFDLGTVVSHIFGKSDVPALKIDLGIDLPTLKAGQQYYIAPTSVAH
ncbi:MAG TPA: signal peptide peptidase SppA [Candidatus Saccharimonadales bacterium]|nr:signal peptide peptidase SppA [Candidatus Saccharimonadales bacterium]